MVRMWGKQILIYCSGSVNWYSHCGIWRFLKKKKKTQLKTVLLYDPATVLPGLYIHTHTLKDTCTPMFTVALFITAKVCKLLQARILEWVAVLFSKGSSQPKDRTQVSCITCRFFTSWAIREAPYIYIHTHTKKHNSKRHMHSNVHSSITYNCQDI